MDFRTHPQVLFWKTRLQDASRLLLRFAYNPVEGMRHLPLWDWSFLLVFQGLVSSLTGLATGIVAKSFVAMLTGFVFIPLSQVLVTGVVSGFFYYTFLLVFKSPTSFLKIYTHVVFAQLPALVIFIITPLLPPLALLGPATAGLLLIVGFTDNFGFERRKIQKLIAIAYAIFVVCWIINTIQHRRQVDSIRDRATPESLDILEKELKNK